jgi:hypothetical protein
MLKKLLALVLCLSLVALCLIKRSTMMGNLRLLTGMSGVYAGAVVASDEVIYYVTMYDDFDNQRQGRSRGLEVVPLSGNKKYVPMYVETFPNHLNWWRDSPLSPIAEELVRKTRVDGNYLGALGNVSNQHYLRWYNAKQKLLARK